jgi:SAM-dependent methyltransferase
MFHSAESYERFMGRWSRLLAPLLIDFTGLPDHGTVLDAGAGTGSLAFTIAERKEECRVVGIDPSKEYVAYATRKNPFSDRVHFETGDAQALRFPDAGFDASLSLLVFNFIPDPGKALSELRRVTKSGGPIAAAVWDYGGDMTMLRAFWDAVASTDPSAEKLHEKHMPLCRRGELTGLWRQGGLQHVREAPLDISTRFDSFMDYWNSFVHGQGPAGAYTRRLAPEARLRLRQEVKRRLSLSSEDKPFTLRARAWSVRGKV